MCWRLFTGEQSRHIQKKRYWAELGRGGGQSYVGLPTALWLHGSMDWFC